MALIKDSKNKYIPSQVQVKAFENVIKAIRDANKKGLVFYGKQENLVAYTKEADRYANQFDFGNLLRGRGCEIHFLNESILIDSGADDYGRYMSIEDEP